MRPAFRDIVQGWTLISGLDDLTDRIERAAEWARANGPLEPDERATIGLMIEAQIARGPDPSGGDLDDGFYTDAEECPDCHGGGTVTVDRPGYHDREETCERCGGSGVLAYDEPDGED